MWCPACRADVAAELSLDSRHFRCARCSLELGLAAGALGAALPAVSPPTDAERNARELLARWNAQNLLESPPAARLAAAVNPPNFPVTDLQLPQTVPVMIDSVPSSEDLSNTRVDPPRRRRKKRRIDRWEDQPLQREAPAVHRAGNWGMAVGQSCAYFGIGLITCGTAIVLWGYFGGPAHLAPTGWLINTVGQMFLFLGVVTLVSSGLDQTTAEVAAKMDVLGETLRRIDHQHRREASAASRRRSNSRQDHHDSGNLPAKAA